MVTGLHAATDLGLTGSGSVNAGTFDDASFSVSPGAFLSTRGADLSGWLLRVDFLGIEEVRDVRMTYASRTTTWLLRKADVVIKRRHYSLCGGIGLGIWNYRFRDRSDLRGAFGYSAEIDTPLGSLSGRKVALAIGYSGLNAPGTGLYDDSFHLQLKYRLLSFE